MTQAVLVADLADRLLARRYLHDSAASFGPGAAVYAFFLKEEAKLPVIPVSESGLLFVGVAEHGGAVRQAFTGQSGFWAVRRVLGCLLKAELGLKAVPKGVADTARNRYQFHFATEGEERLSAWMRAHVTYYACEVGDDAALVENAVIRRLEPPLCLTGWDNPQTAYLRELRKFCADEAWGVPLK